MTEQEWLACTDPLLMLDFLRSKASDRKLRLYACAECRRVWSWFDQDEAGRHCIEVAERYADGQASTKELVRANKAIVKRGWLTVAVYATEQDAGYGAWAVAHGIVDSRIQCVESEEVDATATAERMIQSRLIRDIFDNPFHPVTLNSAWLAWNGGTVVKMAQAIYDDRGFDRLPVLADALEEAGCTNAVIPSHCRSQGPHVRGCWVIDLILGKQ
jgi:hypothetical protein